MNKKYIVVLSKPQTQYSSYRQSMILAISKLCTRQALTKTTALQDCIKRMFNRNSERKAFL